MASFQTMLLKVGKSVDLSHRLGRLAEHFDHDEPVKTAAFQARVAVNAEIFDMIKHAANYGDMALKGLAYAGLPILGAGAVGYGLLEKGKGDAAEMTSDIRNKVLQTGAGLGAMGAGLYGLHRATSGSPGDAGGRMKMSEDAGVVVDELVEKLAAVGKIEDDLAATDITKLSAAAQQLAVETRMLNQAYGAQLLYEASH